MANEWYWVNGTPYCPACVECDTPAVDPADATRGPSGGIRCACCHETEGREYRIAFAKADGSWDVVETFKAAGDDDANRYAEQNYDGHDWYVLDAQGRNINGDEESFDPVRDGWVGKDGRP